MKAKRTNIKRIQGDGYNKHEVEISNRIDRKTH